MNIKITKTIGGERLVQAGGDADEKDQVGQAEGEGEEEETNTFEKLTAALEEISEKFSLDIEKVRDHFQRCCCDFGALEDYLKTGQSERYWDPLQDLALRQDEDSLEYNYLLGLKGEEEIERRKNFLNNVVDEEEEEDIDVGEIQEGIEDDIEIGEDQ